MPGMGMPPPGGMPDFSRLAGGAGGIPNFGNIAEMMKGGGMQSLMSQMFGNPPQ